MCYYLFIMAYKNNTKNALNKTIDNSVDYQYVKHDLIKFFIVTIICLFLMTLFIIVI